MKWVLGLVLGALVAAVPLAATAQTPPGAAFEVQRNMVMIRMPDGALGPDNGPRNPQEFCESFGYQLVAYGRDANNNLSWALCVIPGDWRQ